MTNFIILTKVFFLNVFAVNKKKQSQKSSFQSFLLLGGLTFLLSAFYSYMLFSSSKEQGIGYDSVLMISLAAASLLTLIMSLTQMQGSIFNTRDYETLESLPLKKTTIVGAKIASIFLINAIEDLFIILPSIVLYYVYTKDLYVTTVSFIAGLFISLLPLLISTILGALVAVITKNLKNKTVFQTITYVFYFILIFVLSFSMNNSTAIEVSTILKVMPHLSLVYLGYTKWVYLLFFILLNVISFSFVIILISMLYRPINLMHNKGNEATKYIKENKKENQSLEKLLADKEMKMVTQNAQWLVNSFLGPVMFLLIGVACAVMNFAPDAPAEDAQEVKLVMGAIVAGMGVLMNLTTTSTCSSFSLESNMFEMLLVYPVDPMKYIKAKSMVSIKINFLLNSIASVVLSIVYSIVNGFDLLLVLEFMILPHLSYIFLTIIGTICGLRWPKLEFDNQMQVIKQGTSTAMTMLFCFLPGFLLSGIIVVSSIIAKTTNMEIIAYLGFILTVIMLVSGILISMNILKKKGTKLFREIINR